MEMSKNRAKSVLKRNQRLQSGYFHVWFRGNSRFIVFHDDEDFIEFLKRCNHSADKYNSKITAFVLMDNHVHLQVYSENLSQFITSLLISYTQWFNKKKDLSGSLFGSPFSSSPLYRADMLERNILYIITNPIRAGICKNVREYSWSSYHAFMPDCQNPLHGIIKVDCSIMKSLFGTVSDLNRKAVDFTLNYVKPISEINGFAKGKNVQAAPTQVYVSGNRVMNNNSSEKTSSYWHKVPDYEISQYLNLLLNGRRLSEISKKEFADIARILRYNGNATIQQIAALTHESYFDVRKLL